MNRRDLIALLGGAAVWPVAARAQQGEPMRRIGVLMGWSQSDPEYQARIKAFAQVLGELGWTHGRNLQIDVRWTDAEAGRAQTLAKELLAKRPDVILATTTPTATALQQETRTMPIVFAGVSDPVGAGLIANMPRPGSNITGFTDLQASLGGKWLELLKEISPGLRRVALMFNPDTAPGGGSYYLGPFEAAARTLAVEPVRAEVHDDSEIETEIGSLARDKAGLVGMTDSFMSVHRGTIIAAAARDGVPAIQDISAYVREGGLISYGVNHVDLFRRAAAYVDRILRGEKPADLPVQAPTKFELGLNLRTAKALGLTVPLGLQASADELIE
jgi:putative ABC transport system substrate-binding protein